MIIAPLLQALADPDVVSGRLVNVGKFDGAPGVPVVLTVELRTPEETEAVLAALLRARGELTVPLGRRRR